eukprot:1160564-Pelagomonas_calceolata.AAC.17
MAGKDKPLRSSAEPMELGKFSQQFNQATAALHNLYLPSKPRHTKTARLDRLSPDPGKDPHRPSWKLASNCYINDCRNRANVILQVHQPSLDKCYPTKPQKTNPQPCNTQIRSPSPTWSPVHPSCPKVQGPRLASPVCRHELTLYLKRSLPDQPPPMSPTWHLPHFSCKTGGRVLMAQKRFRMTRTTNCPNLLQQGLASTTVAQDGQDHRSPFDDDGTNFSFLDEPGLDAEEAGRSEPPRLSSTKNWPSLLIEVMPEGAQGHPSLCFKGCINNHPASALLDCGAERDRISTAFCE